MWLDFHVYIIIIIEYHVFDGIFLVMLFCMFFYESLIICLLDLMLV